ncbi:MarR family winged helix-turn-helix transcriptional regulator [Saccharomonospora piscinae]|uniref:MarR family winged helix-turn-helix transcriptional regulator n=1 Tax=Saccharomonospora piscinae TaxID=687388 RepID=UPI001FC99045|nr:MarR family transcriptional regulator [Saccharomonospora piscinae]
MAHEHEVSMIELSRDVCWLAHQFTQRLDAHVRRVAEQVGLTASQVVALRELTGPLTARELASRMSCEPSNATFVIDRLEEQRLVERRPHPTDRRSKQVVLTGDGARLRTVVLDLLGNGSPLITLEPGERESLHALLRKLVG